MNRGKKKKTLLIVDPAMHTPATEAYNLILKIFGEFSQNLDFSLKKVHILHPFLCQQRIGEISSHFDIGGVICLGSIANLTDHHAWAVNLMQDLQKLFDERIPFFGICFSHQLVGELFSYPVDFIQAKDPCGEKNFFEYRTCTLTHQKLALLFAKLNNDDYFSDHKIEIDFRNALLETATKDSAFWKFMQCDDKLLNQCEFRIKQFIEANCPKEFVAHARHEQEVIQSRHGKLCIAASSAKCEIDGFVHPSLPIYSVQTHPETTHCMGDGERAIKNFIYLCHVLA